MYGQRLDQYLMDGGILPADFAIALLIAFGVLAIIGLILGSGDRVVVFLNGWDFFNSFVLAVSLAVFLYLPEGSASWKFYVCGSILALTTLISIVVAEKHNSNTIVGLLVIIIKIVLAPLGVFSVLVMFDKFADKAPIAKLFTIWFAWLLFKLFRTLINGKRVYERKALFEDMASERAK